MLFNIWNFFLKRFQARNSIQRLLNMLWVACATWFIKELIGIAWFQFNKRSLSHARICLQRTGSMMTSHLRSDLIIAPVVGARNRQMFEPALVKIKDNLWCWWITCKLGAPYGGRISFPAYINNMLHTERMQQVLPFLWQKWLHLLFFLSCCMRGCFPRVLRSV